MEWTKFNTHGESSNHAFEVMCNILFETWCKKEYQEELKYFSFVNGSGGDGGLESYGVLKSGDVIGVQAKWFPDKMESAQLAQIKKTSLDKGTQRKTTENELPSLTQCTA